MSTQTIDTIRDPLDRWRRHGTVVPVEPGMQDAFEDLVGPLEREFSARRERENAERRARLPRTLIVLTGATIATIIVGVAAPVAGLVLFLVTSIAGSRSIGRILHPRT